MFKSKSNGWVWKGDARSKKSKPANNRPTSVSGNWDIFVIVGVLFLSI